MRQVLDGKIAQYVAVARRNGKDWYVGAMTNWSPRELEIDFSFLPDRNFSLQAYQDGVNADRMGSDYKMTKTQVNRGTKLNVKLAPGGVGRADHAVEFFRYEEKADSSADAALGMTVLVAVNHMTNGSW